VSHVTSGSAGESAEPSEPATQSLRHIARAAIVLATVISVLALQSARALFVPVILGILASYVLEQPVALLVRGGLPRAVAATVVSIAVGALLALTGYELWNEATIAAAKLPTGAQELRKAIESRTVQRPNPVTQVQQAAQELKELTKAEGRRDGDAAAITKVEIQPTAFNLGDYLWSTSGAALGVVADTVVIALLALYLLVSGDLFRRQLIQIAGPTLSRRKITLQLLDEISLQISRYLFLRVAISVFVGIGTAAALWAIDMAQPGVWGLVAGVANVIPYAGPAGVAAAVGMAAFVQFHTLAQALGAVAVTVVVAILEAYVVTPWLTSRAAEMNTVAVFIGLVFWGWLWGVAGLFVAVPLMMILKVFCEHVEALHPLAILLRGAKPESGRTIAVSATNVT
jgi:predicted PurR-regulated permease PerM